MPILVPDPSPPVTIPSLVIPPLHQKLIAAGDCRFREVRMHCGNDWAFMKLWKENKRQWLERGFSLKKKDGAWVLQQWLMVSGKDLVLTQVGQENLNQFCNPQGELGLKSAPAPALLYPDLPHDIEKILRDYQVQPAKQLYRALYHGKTEWGYAGAVDLSDMGVGKTYMDLGAALATGRKPVVLCPSVGKGGWEKAFALFGAEPYFIGTYEAVRMGVRQHIVTVDAAGKFTWNKPHELVLIMDEAQAVRHDDSLTFRCCAAAIRQGIPIIVASATIAIAPTEMRFAGRVTGLHQGNDDWARFLVEHGCMKARTAWKWDGRSHHLDRINRRLFPSRGCRVRKEDLGERCPETLIEVLPFDVPEGRRIEQEWKETLEMLDRIAAQQGGKKAMMMQDRARMKMWERCEMILVPYVAKRIKQDLSDGRSVAVFMNFNKSRREMSKLLNTHAGFYGGQSEKRRKYYEEQFQADREFVLVSNIGAGGASVSLHNVRGERPRTSYIFPTDHVIRMEQAAGRVDRVDGQGLSLQFIPCLKGAVTEAMVHRTRKKMLRISIINNGIADASVKF